MNQFLGAYENQWVSMPSLVRELGISTDTSRIPLTSVMFNFDPGVKSESFHFEGLKSRFFFSHRNFETFEISINAVSDNDDMIFECAFNVNLFNENEMHQRLIQIETLMRSILENPNAKIG